VWQVQALRHSGTFLKHVIPKIIKPLHVLWHEVIGFLFLSMAAIFGFRTASYIKSYLHASAADAPGQLMRVAMAGVCALLLGWFGVSSFWRARKISRS
jgi:hypothetical protein